MQDGELIQIGYLVKDLEGAVKFYMETLDVGPWEIYTFAPPVLRESMVRGKPSNHDFRIAIASPGHIQVELIQPLTGRSIYNEYLEQKGEGLHHVKYYYKDCQKAIQEFGKKGITVIQSGKFDEDEYYYLDTLKYYGMVIEIGNGGKIRPPERVISK
ncbi:VOC family protein [Atribacter laminatus]|jgi:4-hydroxyphenylpyruvate dioxygenase-like putative hemolysin|uniref:VOC domain-containing protein n=1 Tax=Atribacter laminatus TaxID=2847778 RepID=A0A7T1AMC7_ATRLM|nr:VOC family protein [Atribacter laminatus]QPM68539.1 hypothetical protein RT761_01760 [Atribacter laminatus]